MKNFLFSVILLASNMLYASEIKELFVAVTGIQPSIRSDIYKKVKKLVDDNQREAAIDTLLDHKTFYENKVFTFANKMLTVENDLYHPLNDMSAMVIGLVKNDIDFRDIITANYFYAPKKKVSVSQILRSSNLPFERLSTKSDYAKFLTKIPLQWNLRDAPKNAGVLASRGWGSIYYSGGTNRRAVRGVFNAFLCSDIESWKDRTIEDVWVRRDVTRFPGGNNNTYQNKCKACHAPMDAMSGAFAHVNFSNNTIEFSSKVNKKFLQNGDIFPNGYIPLDSSWENLISGEYSKKFGFSSTDVFGKGLGKFAKMIATSEGFAKCMSIRVYDSVCDKKIDYSSPKTIDLANFFKTNSFNIKKLYKKVVLNEMCK